MFRAAALAGALLLASCAVPAPLHKGVVDLRGQTWSAPVVLAGEWSFGDGFRKVPDTWSADDAGGPDGRGYGVYRLKLLLDPGAPELALRYKTSATSLAVRFDGQEAAHAGRPHRNPERDVSAYAPGVVIVPAGTQTIEFEVSNHRYRVGGLWDAPLLGPTTQLEAGRWYDETGSVALASALAILGVASLLFFLYRRTATFLHLGTLAMLVSLRALVTGEYALVRIVPGLPFDWLIRLEYWTAFLPFPAAALFFNAFFPRMIPLWAARLMTWPSWAFALLTLVAPLQIFTRSIPWFYPFAVPALVAGTVILVGRIWKERQGLLLLLGVAILAGTGLSDMVMAAVFSTTGTSVPWGLGVFVILQATSLVRRFLDAFDANEALLAEKELLVKEVHHRVKNSLQVVASIVSLQGNRSDPEQKAVFRALRQRITAVSLVHEKLYGQVRNGRPLLGDYLIDLLHVQYPADGLGGSLNAEIRCGSLQAGVDYCIDAGLILTELVANAHKHALLVSGAPIEVVVEVVGERLEIRVTDQGPGLPPGFSPQSARGLGFRLVFALMQRNDGRLTFGEGPGTSVRVSLKLPAD